MKHIGRNVIRNRWIVLILITFLISCAERERKNPFDISGNPESPVSLNLSYLQGNVLLTWQVMDLTDFDGFKIYRATDQDSNFQFLDRIPSSERRYVDRSIQNYHWYFYYVTVTSAAGESAPSNIVKTYPGPGTIWILSNLGFSINKYSYDLLHTLESFETNYPAVEWDVHLPDSLIWMAYGTFSRVAPYNLRKGAEDYFITQGLDRPIDIKYIPELGQTFVLDSRKHQVITIEGANIVSNFTLPDENFSQIAFDEDREILYVLGDKRLIRIPILTPTQVSTWMHTPSFEGMDIQLVQGQLFLLLESSDLQISQLLTMDLTTQKWDTLSLSDGFYRLAVDKDNGFYYLAKENSGQNSALVKLSFTGERLFERNKFFSIEDIGLNPIDHSIIVIDRFADTFYLFDPDGNLISKQTDFYDPIRVYIEE